VAKRVVKPGRLPRTGRRRAAGRAPPWALLLLGIGALTACGGEPNRSVVLITLDSTRPDGLGAYGHAPDSTPNLDWLGEEGIVFDHAYTVAPLTLPAHASMLTGLYPPRHGLRDDGISSLPQTAVTLAERAREAGLATAAFVGSAALDTGFGLEQGFDAYEPPARRFFNATGKADERPANEVCARAERWLGQRDPEQPFFLWVHLRDPHPPHTVDERLLTRAGGDAYQAEIMAVDQAIGRLLATLRLREELDPTLVIVAGDHGLARGEHGETGHGDFVWNTTLRVPLIVRRPFGRGGGRRVGEPVSVVDVYATALRGMGLEVRGDVDSHDLLGEQRPGSVYFESLRGALAYGWQPWTGWIDERGKSMHAGRSLLFALDDRAEAHDLATAQAADVAIHRANIATVMRAATLQPDAEGVDAVLREALEAVGYGQASFESQIVETPTEAGRTDPLDRVEEASELHAAETLTSKEDWTASEARLSSLLERYPDNRTAWELLGLVCLRTDRPARAVELLERALAPGLGRAQTWMRLGKARVVTGDEEGALKAFLRCLELDPNEVQALGGLLHLMDGAGLEARAAPLRERFEAIQERDLESR
jgi:choline-sulfatase